MLIAEEPDLGAIGLAKHDVSDRLETCAAPCVKEGIDLRPSVEHHCYPVLLQYSVRFCHRRLEPALINIVLNRAAGAVAIVREVWRIGEDEIDAVRGYLPHHVDAVAMKNPLGEAVRQHSFKRQQYQFIITIGVPGI